jgi:hypothetical protein
MLPAPWGIVELLMVRIAASVSDAPIRGQVVLKVYTDRDWPFVRLIKDPVGL